MGDLRYKADLSYVAKINQHQKSWRAVAYKEFEGMKLEDMIKMAGGIKSRVPRYVEIIWNLFYCQSR